MGASRAVRQCPDNAVARAENVQPKRELPSLRIEQNIASCAAWRIAAKTLMDIQQPESSIAVAPERNRVSNAVLATVGCRNVLVSAEELYPFGMNDVARSDHEQQFAKAIGPN